MEIFNLCHAHIFKNYEKKKIVTAQYDKYIHDNLNLKDTCI